MDYKKINETTHIKPSLSEAEYECLRCGHILKLPAFSTEVAGKCPNCGRFSIFRRTDIQFEKSKYFNNGCFVPRLLADDLMKKYRFITFSDTDELYMYEDGIYIPAESKLKKEIEEILKEDANTRRVTEVINHIRRTTYVDRNSITGNNPHLLPVQNGILDLSKIKEGKIKFLEHSPKFIFLHKLPIKYDPDADCIKIKKFLSQILYERDILVIQELFGYLLWRDYPIQKAFVFVGEGSNGKSTLIRLIAKFIGKENVSSIPLQELENNRFAKVELYGKLANVYADLPDKALTNTGAFKMLVGGDLISAEVKFGGRVKFINYAKLIFSTNKVPETRDNTDAFYRRWIIINFPNKFESDKADPNILEKITTPEELSGLLNFALEGLKRLLLNSQFSYSLSTEEVRIKYIMVSNPVLAFVESCVEANPENWIEKDILYGAFRNFCIQHGLPIKAKNVFARELPRYINVRSERVTNDKGKRLNVFKGIVLTCNGRNEDDENEHNDKHDDGQKYLNEYGDEHDGKDGRDSLYLNGESDSDKEIEKNPAISSNPSNSDIVGFETIKKSDAYWAENILKAHPNMPKVWFVNQFLNERGKAHNRDEIEKLYEILMIRIKGGDST